VLLGGTSGIGLATAKAAAHEGASVVVVDSKTGAQADPVLVDGKTGRPLVAPAFRSAAGPAADARTRRRHPPWPTPLRPSSDGDGDGYDRP